MDKAAIKIYGERNSGTRFLTKLIRQNLRVKLLRGVAPPKTVRAIAAEMDLDLEAARDLYFEQSFAETLGWKHSQALPPEQYCPFERVNGHLIFVTISKNPYAWLLSMHRRPYHQGWRRSLTFKQFLTTPWTTLGRDNTAAELSGPVQLWNEKNRSYMKLSEGLNAINLTYEALLTEPEKMMHNIAEQAVCDWKNESFQLVDFLPGNHNKGYDYYRRYYLGELWKGQLDSTAIRLINDRLDREVMAYFNYQTLSPDL